MPKKGYVWMVPPKPHTLAEAVRQRRLELGLTGYQVAERFQQWQEDNPDPEGAELIKFNQGQLSALERGETKSPDPARMTILNIVLELEPGTLESLAGNRGAALRAQREVPPGSVVILPGAGPIYDLTRRIHDWEDEHIKMLLDRVDRLDREFNQGPGA
jgi:transcriptional regulator with XRE-family HTH domain